MKQAKGAPTEKTAQNGQPMFCLHCSYHLQSPKNSTNKTDQSHSLTGGGISNKLPTLQRDTRLHLELMSTNTPRNLVKRSQ